MLELGFTLLLQVMIDELVVNIFECSVLELSAIEFFMIAEDKDK